MGRDEPLEVKSFKLWNEFLSELTILNQIQIPHCYFEKNVTPACLELHGFSDASEHAYAAVLYLRTVSNDGILVTRLVASKTRIAPTKKQSIPRLELLGALILARLVNTVLRNCLQKPTVTCWVDSTATLFWIRNDRSWKQYVSRRVHEIRTVISRDQWRHCPGSLNPADLPSRGSDANRLLNNNLWWEGPPFLKWSSEEWPRRLDSQSDKAALTELLKSSPEQTHVLTTAVGNTVDLIDIIDCGKFNSFTFLLRVTAQVLRFVELVRKRSLNVFKVCYTDAAIEAVELNRAEILWIRSMQAQTFQKEISYLIGHSNKVKPPYIDQFNLFLDNQNLLKCRGRINNANLLASEKNPVLLPSTHPFVKLLVTDAHYRMKHGGINSTLVALRE